MAIDFPSSPSVDDSFTSGGKTWVWNGTYWKLYGSVLRGLSLEISDTPPASPVSGDMWYESDTGRTFTYYDGAWVELGNTAAVTAFLTDADGDTIVHVEEGTDDDTIRFDTAGSERMTIDASGDVTIGGNLAVGSNTDVEASIDALETDVENINELQRNYQTASYTLVLSDAGKLIEVFNASANTVTIPLNSSVAFPTGTQILVTQVGSGQTSIAGDVGVTLNSKDGNVKLSAQYSAVTLIKRSTDSWFLFGDLSA